MNSLTTVLVTLILIGAVIVLASWYLIRRYPLKDAQPDMGKDWTFGAKPAEPWAQTSPPVEQGVTLQEAHKGIAYLKGGQLGGGMAEWPMKVSSPDDAMRQATEFLRKHGSGDFIDSLAGTIAEQDFGDGNYLWRRKVNEESLETKLLPRVPTEAMLRAMHDGPLMAGDVEMTPATREWLAEMYEACYTAYKE